MGASCPSLLDNVTCTKSILLSFTKIKEFRDIFCKESEKKLSRIFYLLCKDEKEVKKCEEDFKNLVREKKKYNRIFNLHQLLDFILSTLNEELQEIKDRKIEYNNKEFAEKFSEMTNSIIERLFFGSKESKKACENCKKIDYSYEIFSHMIYDLENIELDIEFKNLLTKKEESIMCPNCKDREDYKIEFKYFHLPEIFITIFNCKDFNKKINYYLNFTIQNVLYNLVGFIIKSDEYNQVVEDYNFFFEENNKWYIYKTAVNLILEIKDITDIRRNPIAVFYQRNKNFYYDIYNEAINLLKDQDNTKDLINEHLVADIDYEKYYLVNKNWYNKLIKIFEDEEIYSDNSFINTEENIRNALKMKNIDLTTKYKLYSKRKKKLEDLKKVVNEEIFGLIVPKGFMLIKENVLNNCFKLIDYSEFYKKYLYEVKFGENYIFIKDKTKSNNKNSETILVCYLNKVDNSIDVECILRYLNPCFDEEVEKYISNRGGIEYYYLKKDLKLVEGATQDIIDVKTKEVIGKVINIKNPSAHFDLGRFELNKSLNKNNEDKYPLKMSILSNNENNTGIILEKNNINCSNYKFSNNNNFFEMSNCNILNKKCNN